MTTAPNNFAADIPDSLSHAYNWMSFTPERRFTQKRDDYAATLAQDHADFEAAATAGGTLDQLEEEFTRYRANMRRRWVAAIASDSRCASSFVTGGSNFPARRMEKRHDIAMRRWLEISDFRKRARAAIIDKLNPKQRYAIGSGDDDAIERLTERIAEAEAKQVRMKAVNAAHARYLKNPASLETSGLDHAAVTLIRDYQPAYSWEPHPFAPYQLTNNGAEIRRLKERLAKVTTAKATPQTIREGAAARIEDCPPENRVRLFFPGKPAVETRDALKKHGFIWTPTLGAWQAYRNPSTLEFATKVADQQ